MEPGILYVVATPIGNLDDITLRAIKILQSVDVILCEDTRVTHKLLAKLGIEKKLVALHEHTEVKEMRMIVQTLIDGLHVALVSDAGTPAIADPGVALIQMIHKQSVLVTIVPIVGASAVTGLLSVAGMWANQYQFLGFVPQKKGRETFFRTLEAATMTTVIFETPQRIEKTIQALSQFTDPARRIVIGRELTKQFETIYQTTVEHVATVLKASEVKGEFVIILEGTNL